MTKKILLTGGSGLIGSYFKESYSSIFKDHKVLSPTHKEMDVTNLNSVKKYFEKNQPQIVIHFAAFRDATLAEKQRGDKAGSVWKVNVEGSRNIVKVCKELKIYLIHISTDYVFSGHHKKPGPYFEKDETNHNSTLLSWYGVTKREAEIAVRDKLRDFAIIRICNITRPLNNPKLDYIGKILWLYDQNKIYPMFNDQLLTLTYIPSLVESIIKLIRLKLSGVFHVSTNDLVIPVDLAQYLIKKAGNKKINIQGISIDNYLRLNPRRYPKNGGLSVGLTQKKLGLDFGSWKDAVDSYVKDINKRK